MLALHMLDITKYQNNNLTLVFSTLFAENIITISQVRRRCVRNVVNYDKY